VVVEVSKVPAILDALESLVRAAVAIGKPGTRDELESARRILADIDATRTAKEIDIFNREMAALIAKEQARRSAIKRRENAATDAKIVGSTSIRGFGQSMQRAASNSAPVVTAKDILVGTCGKDGCQRRVAGGGLCYQHR
jgi:hypothetical protein